MIVEKFQQRTVVAKTAGGAKSVQESYGVFLYSASVVRGNRKEAA